MPDRGAPPVLVAAAGSSRRYGRPKLLEEVEGFPVVQRTVVALRAGGGGRTLLSVHPGDRSLVAPLAGLDLWGLVENPEWEEGMASSWRLLSRLVPNGTKFALASPADLPWLSGETVSAVIDAARVWEGRLVVPTFEGRPGHPAAVPAAMLARADELRGEEGFRRWRDEAYLLPVDDAGCVRDVDHPEELA